MKAAIIGMGARASAYVQLIRQDPFKKLDLAAICDLIPAKMDGYINQFMPDAPAAQLPARVTDYRKILEDPAIELVFITTNDLTHKEIAVDCLRAGKHILLEKPLATTLADCQAIYDESRHADRIVKLGFCLRYTSFYEKMLEIVRSGLLGKIICIEAKETLSSRHGASFMRRWHRFKNNNGGFLNAKCSHDLDMLNRLSGSDPQLVSAFGGRAFFNPIEGASDRCESCRLAESCPYYLDKNTIPANSPEEAICPFNADKDIVDHETVLIQYKNGIHVSFCVTMLSAEATRTTVIFGSEATLTGDFASGLIHVRFLHAGGVHTYDLKQASDGHGGGDESLYRALLQAIHAGEKVNDARDGLMSTAIALAAERSMESATVVDLDQCLQL
jgi:predicted dehydrogenase